MKKTTPCTVHYITPKNPYNRRWFADKIDAANWVIERLHDSNFRLDALSGDTWIIQGESCIKFVNEWAK